MKIDMNMVYAKSQLTPLFRLPPARVDAAINSGSLGQASPGVILGAELFRWVAAGSPISPPVLSSTKTHSQRQQTAEAQQPQNGGPLMTQQMSADREFFSRVDQLVAAGMPRSKAVRQVARKDPELRKRMIVEANSDRPLAAIR